MHVYYTPTIHTVCYESILRRLLENRSSFYMWKGAMFP